MDVLAWRSSLRSPAPAGDGDQQPPRAIIFSPGGEGETCILRNDAMPKMRRCSFQHSRATPLGSPFGSTSTVSQHVGTPHRRRNSSDDPTSSVSSPLQAAMPGFGSVPTDHPLSRSVDSMHGRSSPSHERRERPASSPLLGRSHSDTPSPPPHSVSPARSRRGSVGVAGGSGVRGRAVGAALATTLGTEVASLERALRESEMRRMVQKSRVVMLEEALEASIRREAAAVAAAAVAAAALAAASLDDDTDSPTRHRSAEVVAGAAGAAAAAAAAAMASAVAAGEKPLSASASAQTDAATTRDGAVQTVARAVRQRDGSVQTAARAAVRQRDGAVQTGSKGAWAVRLAPDSDPSTGASGVVSPPPRRVATASVGTQASAGSPPPRSPPTVSSTATQASAGSSPPLLGLGSPALSSPAFSSSLPPAIPPPTPTPPDAPASPTHLSHLHVALVSNLQGALVQSEVRNISLFISTLFYYRMC